MIISIPVIRSASRIGAAQINAVRTRDHVSDRARIGTLANLRRTIVRSIIEAVAILGLLIGAIAVTAWVRGDQSDLPFEYEGFD